MVLIPSMRAELCGLISSQWPCPFNPVALGSTFQHEFWRRHKYSNQCKLQINMAQIRRILQPLTFPSHTSLPCSICLAVSSWPITGCLMTVWRGGSERVPVESIETECLHQESQSPELLQPLKDKQGSATKDFSLMKAVSNKHLKSSIQKITKSWPFIPLSPSHCNENMYLTEKTLSLRSPWPLSLFFSLSLRAQNVMIHHSTAQGSSELQAPKISKLRGIHRDTVPQFILTFSL